MLQVVQSYKTGEVSLRTVPVPRCPKNGLLVRNHASLVSIGTERSMIDLGRKSLIGKARARPDLVRRALEKAQREGFWKTYQEAMARLDTPTPLGYSSAGVVLEAGEAAHEFAPGDRVACVGHGYASHAEFIAVPANMATRIPDSLGDDEAAFAMLGVIALHGIREAKLTFGSTVAVIGLGLLGLITVQLLRAYGCRVVAMDINPARAAMARDFGAAATATTTAEMLAAGQALTGGFGCDAVLIVASTKSADPVNAGVALCRPKGRIVVVGVTDIHPDRNELWQKEVEIVVSKAGGAGALDPLYEIDGIDLPIAYARWTQSRNVEEFLRLAAEKRLNLKALVTHRHAIAEADKTYAMHLSGTATEAIGILIEYPHTGDVERRVALQVARGGVRPGTLRVAVIGAGQFGRTTLLPSLEKANGVSLKVLATSSGVSAEHSGRRFGFAECTTDGEAVFARDDIDVVFALTPHSQHARAVLLAIEHGKHLFVEKPLCVTVEELAKIEDAAARAQTLPFIMVGHNRRYSPHTARVLGWLEARSAPLVMDLRVNAGFVPADHWVHADAQGRSRIVGEMTHFLDLMEVLVGKPLTAVSAMRVAGDDRMVINNDNLVANLRFADGSVANLAYSSQGSRGYSREHLEIFSAGQCITSTDFRKSLRYGASRTERFATPSQSFGYAEEIAHFIAAAHRRGGGTSGLAHEIHIMQAAFALETSIATGSEQVIGQ